MYSDRNFEIRPEYRERLPRVRIHGARVVVQNAEPQNELDDAFSEIGAMFIQGVAYLFGLVVILFAACLLAAIVGWLWSFTLTPQQQQLTQERIYEYLQKARGSPARPSGGGGSSDSQPGRSTPTQAGAQDPPQIEVVPTLGEEKGAAEAPAFYDESQSLASRARNNPRIIPAASALQVWGEDRFPGMVEARYDTLLPDGSRGVIVWVPAGAAAGVHESTPGGTSLDQVWGPTLFVLRENECVVSGSFNLCVMRGDSSPLPEGVQ